MTCQPDHDGPSSDTACIVQNNTNSVTLPQECFLPIREHLGGLADQAFWNKVIFQKVESIWHNCTEPTKRSINLLHKYGERKGHEIVLEIPYIILVKNTNGNIGFFPPPAPLDCYNYVTIPRNRIQNTNRQVFLGLLCSLLTEYMHFISIYEGLELRFSSIDFSVTEESLVDNTSVLTFNVMKDGLRIHANTVNTGSAWLSQKRTFRKNIFQKKSVNFGHPLFNIKEEQDEDQIGSPAKAEVSKCENNLFQLTNVS